MAGLIRATTQSGDVRSVAGAPRHCVVRRGGRQSREIPGSRGKRRPDRLQVYK